MHAVLLIFIVDTFTAVNLLVFDRWTGIDPAIPIHISRWIFAACIILSWVLCLWEWIRAIRVIRGNNVVDSYLDPLAATLQSIRPDANWSGWRRFLAFTELTRSKKGADYVAIFSYFQFKGAIRMLIAEGPRQAINAITLYSVLQANLIPVGENAASDGHSAFVQFWVNVKILGTEHTVQAVTLLSMLFTFVIWAITMLCFIAACLCYVGFLIHYIPKEDGTLSRYCRRKINTRLGRIVDALFKEAVTQQDVRRRHQERKLAEKNKTTVAEMDKNPNQPPVPEKDHAVLGINRPRLGEPALLKPALPTLPVLASEQMQPAATMYNYQEVAPTSAPAAIIRQPTNNSYRTDLSDPSLYDGQRARLAIDYRDNSPAPVPILRQQTNNTYRTATSEFSHNMQDTSLALPGRPGLVSRTATMSTHNSQDGYESDDYLMSNAATIGTSLVAAEPLPYYYEPQQQDRVPTRGLSTLFAELDSAETGTASGPTYQQAYVTSMYPVRTTTAHSKRKPSITRKPLPSVYTESDVEMRDQFPPGPDMGVMPLPSLPRPSAAIPERNFSLLHRSAAPQPGNEFCAPRRNMTMPVEFERGSQQQFGPLRRAETEPGWFDRRDEHPARDAGRRDGRGDGDGYQERYPQRRVYRYD